jgi:hypothetical protein
MQEKASTGGNASIGLRNDTAAAGATGCKALRSPAIKKSTWTRKERPSGRFDAEGRASCG